MFSVLWFLAMPLVSDMASDSARDYFKINATSGNAYGCMRSGARHGLLLTVARLCASVHSLIFAGDGEVPPERPAPVVMAGAFDFLPPHSSSSPG